MLYPKNVPNIERGLRIVLALGIVALLLFGKDLIGSPSPLMIGFILVNALFIALTGFVGWCPACWLFGRKLKSKSQAKNS